MIRLLDTVIACGLALTAVLATSSGFSVNFFGLAIQLHDWVRPLVATAVLAVIHVWWGRRAGRREGRDSDAAAWRPAHIAILATILSATGYGIVHLTAICGGSDSYGYVSASELIRRGQLIQPQPIASWLPVENPLSVAAPLGYVAAADRRGIAPVYPLGLPVLMALATLLAGSIGPYLVPVVCGGGLVVIAGRLAATWYGWRAGWLAAALVASDALVVTYAKQPMSDVPATMFAVLAVWCLAAAPRRTLAAGLAAGASFLIRPGGVGAIVVLFCFAVSPRDRRPWHGMLFIAGLLPFVAAQALLQWRLFGSPLASGYGPLAMIYGGAGVGHNLEIYAGAMWTIHSLVWFAGLLAAWAARPRTPLTLAIATLIASAVPYVLYFEFDHWETLRFLMPAMVLLSVAAAGGLTWMAGRLGSPAIAGVIVAACAIVPAVECERFLRREGVPGLSEAELRYPLVAARVRERSPANAIVLAAQHSGSIRHYGDRMTLRWDLLRAEDFAPAMTALAGRGHPIYVVLEGSEQDRFTAAFAAPLQHLQLSPVGQIRNIQIWELVR
ncbi:MAG: hypothetical protein ABI868_02150 [Acidobacteriota bacterium]